MMDDIDQRCKLPPAGWECTRSPGHEGPCAAVPVPSKPVLAIIDGLRILIANVFQSTEALNKGLSSLHQETLVQLPKNIQSLAQMASNPECLKEIAPTLMSQTLEIWEAILTRNDTFRSLTQAQVNCLPQFLQQEALHARYPQDPRRKVQEIIELESQHRKISADLGDRLADLDQETASTLPEELAFRASQYREWDGEPFDGKVEPGVYHNIYGHLYQVIGLMHPYHSISSDPRYNNYVVMKRDEGGPFLFSNYYEFIRHLSPTQLNTELGPDDQYFFKEVTAEPGQTTNGKSYELWMKGTGIYFSNYVGPGRDVCRATIQFKYDVDGGDYETIVPGERQPPLNFREIRKILFYCVPRRHL